MKKVLIIAEAGVNHNGDIGLAKKLINAAVDAGVDYVKFQTFKTEKLVSRKAQKATYQQQNTTKDDNNSQFEMLKKLELTEADHHTLTTYCRQKNIRFLSTAFDEESIDLLEKNEIDLYKIPSGEITNLPYLQKIASLKKPVIISTGMCTMDEIKEAVQVMQEGGIERTNITVLHCNTEYPTPFADVNLKAMLSIQKELNVAVGYSDHTTGIEVPIAAVALGATVIEKHFTLDKNMDGPDHKASLDPRELNAMVQAIRNTELSLGSELKMPSNSELKNKAIARKSIHLKNALKTGHVITADDLEMKRPGDGISPMRMKDVIGKKIKSDLEEEHKLSFNDIE